LASVHFLEGACFGVDALRTVFLQTAMQSVPEITCCSQKRLRCNYPCA
jgi:hypothetical protein